MSNPVYSVEAITAATSGLRVRRMKNQNFKCDISALLDKGAQTPNDDEKFEILVAAKAALVEQGYSCAVSLSQRNQDGSWSSWPCLWVNAHAPTSRSNAEADAKIAAMATEMAELKGMLAAFLGAQAPAATTVETVAADPRDESTDDVDANPSAEELF